MVEINRDTHRQPHFQRHQRISASRLSVCVCVCGQPERPHANVGRVAGSQFWSDLQFFGPILGQQKSSELFAREREGSGSIWKLEKQKNCFWKLLAWSLIKKRGEQEKKFSNCTIFRKFRDLREFSLSCSNASKFILFIIEESSNSKLLQNRRISCTCFNLVSD